jgi:hypothetical protein
MNEEQNQAINYQNIPLITTIIPTFRRPKLLKRAIESVLAQSFKNLKIYVYDNASGDGTEDVVAEYIRHDDRVFYYKNSENIGGINNMIQGVEAVTTSFYSVLNDDDFLLPYFYENALQAFDKYPEAGFVCAKTITVDLIKKKLQFRNGDWLHGIYQPSSEIASKMYISHFCQTGVLLRTSMRQLIGPFEKSGDDRLYLVMAAASSPFVVLTDYGAVYTIHSQSYSETVGLRGGEFFSVCEALLSTVDWIMKLDLQKEEKVHLLMLAIDSYGASFDSIKLNHLIAGMCGEDKLAVMSLPSRITSPGLFAKIYEVTPKRLHLILTHCINVIRRIRQTKSSKKAKANWFILPEDAYCFFLNDDSNVARFLSSMQQGNRLWHEGGEADR